MVHVRIFKQVIIRAIMILKFKIYFQKGKKNIENTNPGGKKVNLEPENSTR